VSVHFNLGLVKEESDGHKNNQGTGHMRAEAGQVKDVHVMDVEK
jgi:hypothetical protein